MSSTDNIGNAARQSVGSATQPGSSVIRRGPSKLWTVCIFILVVEMCERLCYYTISGSLRNFLEDAGPPGADGTRGIEAGPATSISACFSMLSYMSCILGGYLADNRLGRYRTILYFALVYVFGVFVVAFSAYPAIISTDLSEPLFLLGAMVFVAIGTGAIKPNVMNFGAEQYDTNDAAEREQLKSFFSYFYLVINIGCLGAFGYCVNLATSDATKSDPGNGYFKAYCIAAVGMMLALLAFVSGTPRYAGTGGVTHKPMISVMRSYLMDSARKTASGKVAVLGWCLIPTYCVIVLVGSLMNIPFACDADVPDTFLDIGGFVVCPPIVLTWLAMGLAVFSLFFAHCHPHEQQLHRGVARSRKFSQGLNHHRGSEGRIGMHPYDHVHKHWLQYPIQCDEQCVPCASMPDGYSDLWCHTAQWGMLYTRRRCCHHHSGTHI